MNQVYAFDSESSNVNSIATESQKSKVSNYSDTLVLIQNINIVNDILKNLDMSCMKDQRFYKTQRLGDAQKLVDEVFRNFSKNFFKVANLDVEVIEPISHNYLEDSQQFREVLGNLQKGFISEKSFDKKLVHLSLLPIDWNFRQIWVNLSYF